MKYNKVGTSSIHLSEIGFGTIPILTGPKEIMTEYYSPSESIAARLLREAFENGINFYDTAVVPEYGDAERKLGLAFKKDRGKVVFASKARAYTSEAMQSAIHKSLRNLGTDYIDIYFIHQITPSCVTISLDEERGALGALLQAQKDGKIREIGVGTHYAGIATSVARIPSISVIQIPYNLLETGIYDSMIEASPDAGRKVVFNKVLASGALTSHFPIRILLHFALDRFPLSVLLGIGTRLQLLTLLDSYKDTNQSDYSHFYSTVQDAFLCNRCQKCECPHGISIPHLLRYRAYALLGFEHWALKKWLEKKPNVERCKHGCRECLSDCPRQLDIPRLICEADTLFARLVHVEEV